MKEHKFSSMKVSELLDYVFPDVPSDRFVPKIGPGGQEAVIDTKSGLSMTCDDLVKRAVNIRMAEICDDEIGEREDLLTAASKDEAISLLREIRAYMVVADEVIGRVGKVLDVEGVEVE